MNEDWEVGQDLAPGFLHHLLASSFNCFSTSFQIFIWEELSVLAVCGADTQGGGRPQNLNSLSVDLRQEWLEYLLCAVC